MCMQACFLTQVRNIIHFQFWKILWQIQDCFCPWFSNSWYPKYPLSWRKKKQVISKRNFLRRFLHPSNTRLHYQIEIIEVYKFGNTFWPWWTLRLSYPIPVLRNENLSFEFSSNFGSQRFLQVDISLLPIKNSGPNSLTPSQRNFYTSFFQMSQKIPPWKLLSSWVLRYGLMCVSWCFD